MKKTRLVVVAALLAATVTGCIIRTARPCRNECW
jgi:predicted small secreted protein